MIGSVLQFNYYFRSGIFKKQNDIAVLSMPLLLFSIARSKFLIRSQNRKEVLKKFWDIFFASYQKNVFEWNKRALHFGKMHVAIASCYKQLTIFRSGILKILLVCSDFFDPAVLAVHEKKASGLCALFSRWNLESPSCQ